MNRDYEAAKNFAATGINQWENEEMNIRACYLDLTEKLEQENIRANNNARLHITAQAELALERKAREEAERNLGEYVNGSNESLAAKLFEERKRNRVLQGKWFDADCQEKGCQSLVYLQRAERAEAELEELNNACMKEAVRADTAESSLAELIKEVREWVCVSCNTVYPGPPAARDYVRDLPKVRRKYR